MNRTIGDLQALKFRDPQAEWYINLGIVLVAYRSSVQDSSVFTPHFLVLGRDMGITININFWGPCCS